MGGLHLGELGGGQAGGGDGVKGRAQGEGLKAGQALILAGRPHGRVSLGAGLGAKDERHKEKNKKNKIKDKKEKK